MCALYMCGLYAHYMCVHTLTPGARLVCGQYAHCNCLDRTRTICNCLDRMHTICNCLDRTHTICAHSSVRSAVLQRRMHAWWRVHEPLHYAGVCCVVYVHYMLQRRMHGWCVRGSSLGICWALYVGR